MLVILSGVAGAGKDTIKKELLKRMDKVTTLPSFTDRPPRATDIAGETYNFVTTRGIWRDDKEQWTVWIFCTS